MQGPRVPQHKATCRASTVYVRNLLRLNMKLVAEPHCLRTQSLETQHEASCRASTVYVPNLLRVNMKLVAEPPLPTYPIFEAQRAFSSGANGKFLVEECRRGPARRANN